MTEVRFFVHCPRGFVNERSIKASDDKKVIEALKESLGDGMELTFEEVSELEAKKLFYQKNVSADVQTYYHHLSDDLSDKVLKEYPEWENVKKAMIQDAKINYDELYDK